MSDWQWIFSAISAISLFLYGLSGFSRELLDAGGAKLTLWLGKATANRYVAATLGAAFTAFIQSSTAVTALAISLVDSGVLRFGAALAILLGANVGTTTTAWLVSLKLAVLAPSACRSVRWSRRSHQRAGSRPERCSSTSASCCSRST